jgi:glycosyltransferase involved in cell wall biosynthesis
MSSSLAGSPRPKICHLVHLDGPGGGPVVVVDHLKTFAGEFDLSAIHGGSGRIAETCETMGLPHWQLPLERLWKLPWGVSALVARLRKLQPDLVVLHGQWAGPMGTVAARLVGVPRMIYVCHWPSFYTDWDLGRVVRNRLAEALPCRWSDRVVVLSQGNAYQYLIRQLVAPGKLRLIHNSLDPARVPLPERAAEVRRQHAWSDAHVHVVSVGRLSDQKRLDWLLRSWALVIPRAPEARLWIVGAGPEKAALESLAGELGITGTCTLLGPQPKGIEYIAAADLVAMTTLYEGHANLPLEAMACGKALVTNAVDGVTDTVRDGIEGFLVSPGDIDQFAGRLVQLITDPALRRTMGEHGLIRVREFSPEKTMGKYRALIHEVLALPGTQKAGW